jgi:hypothetical protein
MISSVWIEFDCRLLLRAIEVCGPEDVLGVCPSIPVALAS